MNDDEFTEEKAEMPNGNIRIRYRFGDKEVEAEGRPEEVNRHLAFFLSHVLSEPLEQDEKNLLSEGTPLLVQSNDVSSQTAAAGNDKVGTHQLSDLEQYYREKAPKVQRDEVLVITSFYQRYLGYPSLSLEEYEQAYSMLRRLAVEMPSNMKSSVRNVVDRTKFLYNPERGKFALTIPGEELVERLPSSE